MVAQEDEFGCGVACVANLLDIPYAAAVTLFSKPDRVKTAGYYCRDIVQALAIAGVQSEFKYIKPALKKEIYRTRAIVFIKRSPKYPAGHYLLRIHKGWSDPWLNFPLYPRNAGTRKRLPGQPIYLIRSK